MGITIHFVDKNWQLEFKLLDIIDLKESHSGIYLFRKMLESLEEFDIIIIFYALRPSRAYWALLLFDLGETLWRIKPLIQRVLLESYFTYN